MSKLRAIVNLADPESALTELRGRLDDGPQSWVVLVTCTEAGDMSFSAYGDIDVAKLSLVGALITGRALAVATSEDP